jgi:hypothetical protein
VLEEFISVEPTFLYVALLLDNTLEVKEEPKLVDPIYERKFRE